MYKIYHTFMNHYAHVSTEMVQQLAIGVPRHTCFKYRMHENEVKTTYVLFCTDIGLNLSHCHEGNIRWSLYLPLAFIGRTNNIEYTSRTYFTPSVVRHHAGFMTLNDAMLYDEYLLCNP